MRSCKCIRKQRLIIQVGGSNPTRAVQEKISCGNSQAAAPGEQPIRIDGLGNGKSSGSAARIGGAAAARLAHAHSAKVHLSAINKRAVLKIEAKCPAAGTAA